MLEFKSFQTAKQILSGVEAMYTSLLIEAGVGIKESQERLGHPDTDTTMNIYAHMTNNIEEKTFHKFSQLTKGLL